MQENPGGSGNMANVAREGEARKEHQDSTENLGDHRDAQTDVQGDKENAARDVLQDTDVAGSNA